jgi:hypothetical protein
MKSETKKEYDDDANRYWRNIESAKNPGPSADSAEVADKYLPGKAEEQKILDRFEKGFTKTSRSGSFTDKPNASPAIFPNGLGFASDFIDEMTPGKFKKPEEGTPVQEQVGRVENVPKPAFIIADTCLDCMKPVDPGEVAMSICVITEQDTHKLAAMHVKFADMGVNLQCMPCYEANLKLGQSQVPLALVHSGGLTDPQEIALAIKYGAPIRLHDGEERTLGQWYMHKRQQRLTKNLHNYLMSSEPDSPIFRTEKVG